MHGSAPSMVRRCVQFGDGPLHLVCMKGDLETAKLLVEGSFRNTFRNVGVCGSICVFSGGADLGAFNDFGFTPLHCAAAGGHKQLVQYLIEEGSDPSAKDKV